MVIGIRGRRGDGFWFGRVVCEDIVDIGVGKSEVNVI